MRLNGRVFEAVAARLQRRRPCDLYHAALEVQIPDGRFVVEQAPAGRGDGSQRGVVSDGVVGSRLAGRMRIFRYELRRWRGGEIPDVAEAVESPRRLTDDAAVARRVLELVPAVPTPVWGRDELNTGEMWNSNSVVAWLLERSGLRPESIALPAGGRAPGWRAGIVAARRQPTLSEEGRKQCPSLPNEDRTSRARSGVSPSAGLDTSLVGSARWSVAGLAGVVGVGALYGGVGLLVDAEALGAEPSWLEGTPFPDYRLPGVVLLVVIGGGMLATAFASLRRSRFTGLAALVMGFTLLVWGDFETVTIGYQGAGQLVLLGLFVVGPALPLIAIGRRAAFARPRLQEVHP